MANSQIRPGTNYARLGSFQATATEALEAGDVVWVSGREGKRKRVSKASAATVAAGGNAVLFVCVGGATAEGRVLISPAMTVTKENVVTRELETIAALSGATAGDPVYLHDTAGTITLTPVPDAVIERVIGSVIDEYAWEFGNIGHIL